MRYSFDTGNLNYPTVAVKDLNNHKDNEERNHFLCDCGWNISERVHSVRVHEKYTRGILVVLINILDTHFLFVWIVSRIGFSVLLSNPVLEHTFPESRNSHKEDFESCHNVLSFPHYK